MNLAKLAHIYDISVAEKEALRLRNRVYLTRIASTLQQRSNAQILQSIEGFLNVYN